MRYYDPICEVGEIVIKNILIFKRIEASGTIEVPYKFFFFVSMLMIGLPAIT